MNELVHRITAFVTQLDQEVNRFQLKTREILSACKYIQQLLPGIYLTAQVFQNEAPQFPIRKS